jgi:epoxyqueuosine reductase QueG
MELASRLQNDLEILGVKSVIIEPTIPPERSNSVEYLITLTADVSHKMVATRAGLGWIGKTDLFVSKRFGPRLRLVSLLMDHPLKPAHIPITKSRCGTCTLCVDRCPAGAANGKLWDIRVRREEFFDAHKCRETCGKLARTRLNVDRRVCGICVSVCPIGKKVKK